VTDKHTLLIVAHGSRREASNEEFRKLTEYMQGNTDGKFSAIECAFLELAEPSIPTAIDAAVAGGAKKITVLPYFLVAGRHVVEDIPQIVADKRLQYPEVTMHLVDYFGADSRVFDLLATQANAAAEQQ